MEYFLMTGKKETLSRCFKKVTNKTSRTIAHFFFFQSLPIFFQCIIYDNLLKYFLDNNLISQKQSEFRPGGLNSFNHS